MRWSRRYSSEQIRWFRSLEEKGERSPLDRDPQPDILPEAVPVWECFGWMLTWSSGFGGVELEALERYFAPGYAGEYLSEHTRRLCRRVVPDLLGEMQRLASREREGKRAARELERQKGGDGS